MSALPTPSVDGDYKRHEYSYIVHGAKVKCTCAGDSTTKLVIPKRGADTGYGPKAMHIDAKFENFEAPFAQCSADPNNMCTLSPLNETWELEGEYIAFSDIPFSDREAVSGASNLLYPLMWKSTLVCWKGGIISIEDNGQDPSITQPDKSSGWGELFGISGFIACLDTPAPGPADLAALGVLIVGGIGILWASGKSNPNDLKKGMSNNQQGYFQREIEDWKRMNGMRPDDNLPWEILVMLAEEVKKLFK